MSEDDVINFLKRNSPQLFSLREICDALSEISNSRAISHVIHQLIKHKELKVKKIEVRIARKIYGPNLKRGLCLYFVEE